MVMAKLHVICGNCGSNEFLKYEIEPEGHDYDGELRPAVFISCENCTTLHDLSNTVSEKKPEVSKVIGCKYHWLDGWGWESVRCAKEVFKDGYCKEHYHNRKPVQRVDVEKSVPELIPTAVAEVMDDQRKRIKELEGLVLSMQDSLDCEKKKHKAQLRKVIKVWTVKGIELEDALRIVEGYGCDNDTLRHEESEGNRVPFEITIAINEGHSDV